MCAGIWLVRPLVMVSITTGSAEPCSQVLSARFGAPNLTDKTWLYGSSEATIIETITKGRINQMPAHKALLDEARIHLLTAYVHGLSQGLVK